MKKITTLLFLLMMMHNSVSAIGTLKDTVIVASANNLLINYKTLTGINQPPVTGSTHLSASPVIGVYGFNFYSTATANLLTPTDYNRSTGAGVSVNFFQNIVNISNDTASISMRVTGSASVVQGDVGTLANWIFLVENPTLNLSVDTVSSNWRPLIRPASNAVNDSQAEKGLNVFIAGFATPNTQYTGFNNNLYGGYNDYTYYYSATIAGPSLRLLSKTSTVNSTGLTNYSGGAHDLVPGAKVTYTIVIINDGGADANTLNITERIPANTRFLSIDAGDHNSVSYVDLSDVIHNTFDLPSANVKSVIFKKNVLLQNGGTATFNYSVTLN